MKKKKIYGLRIRLTDKDIWAETVWYKTQKKRDKVAAMNRIIGGVRVLSFEENKTTDEINLLCLNII